MVIAIIHPALQSTGTLHRQVAGIIPKRTVRRRVVRAEVEEEHKVLVVSPALHPPVFRQRSAPFPDHSGFGQLKRVEFGRARRIIFARRMALRGFAAHHDARRVRGGLRYQYKHLPDIRSYQLALGKSLVKVGAQVVSDNATLEHDIAITLNGNQVVENGKIRGEPVTVRT